MNPIESADNFLQTGEKFRLGHLVTEQTHPLTQNLSEWVEEDLARALLALKKVDDLALEKFTPYLPEVKLLHQTIKKVHKNGGRIFLCGCGATGRLSLTLESLWRQQHKSSEQVQAFMAGGDVALVNAIEGFEDFPQFGAHQLMQLGFGAKDLLIACTEGGETPFVIGATEKAASLSQHKPFFIYCNPRDVLLQTVDRSRAVIENPDIRDFSWEVGPMALAGSTRMQASTVLQWGVGLALFCSTEDEIDKFHLQLLQSQKTLELDFLEEFIERETEIYKNQEWVHYYADSFAITVFTDNTERAPTFSLQPFAPLEASLKQLSLSYVSLLGAQTPQEAWSKLLARMPHCLDWQGKNQLSYDYLYRFDFSEKALEERQSLTDQKVHRVNIYELTDSISIQVENQMEYNFAVIEKWPLLRHTLLKMILNIHSTCVMGKLGRYKNNMMTWVKPSNGKLIDRAGRYVKLFLQYEGAKISYEEVVRTLFEEMQDLKINESIVLKTYNSLKNKK